MPLPCEVANKYLVPAIRSLIARRLIDEYNYTQINVAKKLGVTQAAVSQYLYSKRGMKAVEKILDEPELRDILDKLVKKIAESGVSIDDVASSLCEVCRAYRRKIKEL